MVRNHWSGTIRQEPSVRNNQTVAISEEPSVRNHQTGTISEEPSVRNNQTETISQEPSVRSHQSGTTTVSHSALWWTHLSLLVMVCQRRSCWSRWRISEQHRRRRCRTLFRLQDKGGTVRTLAAPPVPAERRRRRDSPLSLLLSDSLEEKMPLGSSFFFSAGADLQTDM